MNAEDLRLIPFNVLSIDNDYILINGENLTIIKIDKSDYLILNSIKEKNNKNDLKDNYTLLRDYDLISRKIVPSKKKSNKLSPITHLTLFVVQKCNLKCTYCYGNEGEYGEKGIMNVETARKAVDWLIYESKEKKELGISFFGGEPLMNFSLIKKITQYAKIQGSKFGKQFEFGITTNGVLLNDENISFMMQNNMIPVISFDGPKEIHDKNRLFKNGKGTYDYTVIKIKELLKNIPNSICRATLIDGRDYAYIERHLKEIGFKYIQLTVASPSLLNVDNHIKRNVPNTFEFIKEISRDIINYIKTRDSKNLKDIQYSGIGWHLSRMIEQFINKQKRYFACGAGRSGVAITTSGDIQLCHRFVGLKEFSLGSIFHDNIERNIYQNSPTVINEKCKLCFAKYFCAGGCYHDNLGVTGSIFSPAVDMCSFMQNLAIIAGFISTQLNSEDVSFLIKNEFILKKTCLLDIF